MDKPDIPIVVDDSAWPLVIVTLPVIVAVEDLDAFFAWCPAIGRRGRYACVTNALAVDLSQFTAAHRKCAARHLDQLTPWFKRQLICETYVISSALARGALTAIRWLTPLSWPAKTFSTMEQAITFSHQEIEKSGLSNLRPSA